MKQWTFDLLAVIAVFVAYTITIRLALGLGLGGSLLGGLANTIPVVIFGSVVRRMVLKHLMGKPAPRQLIAHLLLCAAFMLLSYWLLIVLLGVFYGGGPDGFVVRPFNMKGVAWQSLENITIYALIAAVSYLQADPRRPVTSNAAAEKDSAVSKRATPTSSGPDDTAPEAPAPAAMRRSNGPSTEPRVDTGHDRYFVKIGDELRPLDLASVVSISGAGDYAEVRTVAGTHLVRVTLADFAGSLDPAKYVRVHRSWIVNTDHIAWAESAGGGRLLLHLETGQTVSTSREGARLLRNRVL